MSVFALFFFFQAEDGIRDLIVTGVQTCALPISLREVLPALRHPEVLRFFVLSSHYRGPINYSLEQLEQADAALGRLYTALRDLPAVAPAPADARSEEHTSELQSRSDLVCRLLLEKKKKTDTFS